MGKGGQLFACAVCITAAWWSVQLARADAAFRLGTAEGVARAVELAPGNAEYLSLAALQAEYDGRDAEPLLRRMTALHPRASAPRIRMGLAAELRGDAAGAEQWLLGAYAVDRQFEPRWTLANFYFRQGRRAEFWMWMRPALEVSYGDRRPAFELCWRMSGDAEEILRAMPEREDVAADYLVFLMNRPGALITAAARVHREELLLAAVDVLLEAKRYGDAVTVWRQAGRAEPVGVTAPNFAGPQTGHGFDWRWANAEGVQHVSRGRVRLTGAQPESVEIVRQYVGGLRAGARYGVQAESSVQVPGLMWRLDREGDAEVAVLTLRYERPRGEARAEAEFELSGVRLLLQ
jgi:hypothetical protein